MTFAEAAMIMMSGDGEENGEVQKFELPEKVEVIGQETSTAYKNYTIMETYSDHQRRVALYTNRQNSGYSYSESVSALSFYDNVDSNIPDHTITFYGFYID